MSLEYLSEEVASMIFEFFYTGPLGAEWDKASPETKEHFLKLADSILELIEEEGFLDLN